MLLSTEGIVLRQVKIAGGRRMLSLFTKKYGRLEVGAGASEKNSRSKSALATRPFTYGAYELFENRGYYNYNSGEVKRSYYSLGEDLDKYLQASFVLELTGKALPEGMPQPRLFSLLLNYLAQLEKRQRALETLTLAYEIKLLSLLGVAPVLDRCSCCGAAGPLAGFSVPEGGMICATCQREKNESDGKEALLYHPKFDIVKVISFFQKKPLEAFDRIGLEPGTAGPLQTIIREYISYHMDVGTLKSEGMLTEDF